MAGPAIRALELARVLADHCEVTLAAPAAQPARRRADRAARGHQRGLRRAARRPAHPRRRRRPAASRPAPALRRRSCPIRYVADLYNPLDDRAARGAGRRRRPARAAPRAAASRARSFAQCAVADFIVCASEKQRDLWLGGLGLAGLIDLGRLPSRPHLPRVSSTSSPSGCADRRPAHDEPVLKGVWPGIEPDDQRPAVGRRDLALARRADADPRRRAAGRRGPARAPVLPGRRPPRRRPHADPVERRGGDRLRARARPGGPARALQPRLGRPTRSARATCSRPTSASPPTTTTSRPASRSAPACSTTCGRACRWC